MPIKKQTKLKLLIAGILVAISLLALTIWLVVVLLPQKSVNMPTVIFNSPQRAFTVFNQGLKGDLYGPVVISVSNNINDANSILTVTNQSEIQLTNFDPTFQTIGQLWNFSFVGAPWPALQANVFNQSQSNLTINENNQLVVSNDVGTYFQSDTTSLCYPNIQSIAFSTSDSTLLLSSNLSLVDANSSVCLAGDIFIGILPEQTIYISAN
jgi:hypothetical protein